MRHLIVLFLMMLVSFFGLPQTSFLSVGFHSPETTKGVGKNNPQLAKGRAAYVNNYLKRIISGLPGTNFKQASGGDSQVENVRKTRVYFSTSAFIERIEVSLTPPTKGF